MGREGKQAARKPGDDIGMVGVVGHLLCKDVDKVWDGRHSSLIFLCIDGKRESSSHHQNKGVLRSPKGLTSPVGSPTVEAVPHEGGTSVSVDKIGLAHGKGDGEREGHCEPHEARLLRQRAHSAAPSASLLLWSAPSRRGSAPVCPMDTLLRSARGMR